MDRWRWRFFSSGGEDDTGRLRSLGDHDHRLSNGASRPRPARRGARRRERRDRGCEKANMRPAALRATAPSRRAVDLQGQPQHAETPGERRDAIDRSGEAEQPRRQRRSAPAAPCRAGSGGASSASPADHRQHRHAGARIVVRLQQRQRPEMRRRPHEDDEEQDDRLRRLTTPVTAAQPIIGGKAPAAPPMTMFCGVQRFSHIV